MRKFSFETYKKACKEVIKRSSECCEVMIDDLGSINSEDNKHRCGKRIPFDRAKAINFAHLETRNGKSDEWVCDPENIVYSCDKHHLEQHSLGCKIERCDYNEIMYIPEE